MNENPYFLSWDLKKKEYEYWQKNEFKKYEYWQKNELKKCEYWQKK